MELLQRSLSLSSIANLLSRRRADGRRRCGGDGGQRAARADAGCPVASQVRQSRRHRETEWLNPRRRDDRSGAHNLSPDSSGMTPRQARRRAWRFHGAGDAVLRKSEDCIDLGRRRLRARGQAQQLPGRHCASAAVPRRAQQVHHRGRRLRARLSRSRKLARPDALLEVEAIAVVAVR